jgi:hypothetical protein
MEVGEVYVMQRGPTRRALTVTLLNLTAPSGVRGRVMVRVEDGVGRGREIEAPSSSLYPMYEEEPEKIEAPYKPPESRHEPAPAGWLPKCGESVTWSKTGGIIFRVKELTREGALISGELLGVAKEYRVPFDELAPVATRALTVVQAPAEARPPESTPEEEPEVSPPALSVVDPGDDWVEALIFSPGCIAFYRRRFAKGLSLAAAERKLRGELATAKKVRPARGNAYLCLRVPKRFDAVLRESPTRGSADALYIDGLRPYVRRVRRRRAA